MSESEAAGDKVLLEIDSWINLNRRLCNSNFFLDVLLIFNFVEMSSKEKAINKLFRCRL